MRMRLILYAEVFHDCLVGAVEHALAESPEFRLGLLQEDGVLYGLLAQFGQFFLHLRIVTLEYRRAFLEGAVGLRQVEDLVKS